MKPELSEGASLREYRRRAELKRRIRKALAPLRLPDMEKEKRISRWD
jgi:hypothetical protein